MKKIALPPVVNLPLLTEELFASFPEWKYPDPLGRGWDVTSVVVLTEAVIFPDVTAEVDVQAVIDRHDSTRDSRNQTKDKDDKKNLASAKKKLKDLGLTQAEIDVMLGAK